MDVFTQQERDEGMDAYWNDCGLRVDATLRINYCGSDGSPTERTIDVTHFADDMIRAHCRLRNEIRTFRADRIMSCVDVITGHETDDALEYLYDLYKQTPDYSYQNVLTEHLDILRALLYVTEYSGFSEAQRVAIICNLCRKLSNDSRISTRMVAPTVVQYQRASFTSFKQTIGRLSKSLSPKNQASLLRMATKAATSIEPTNKFSQEALDYMAKRFG